MQILGVPGSKFGSSILTPQMPVGAKRGRILFITDLEFELADVLTMAALPGDLFSGADASLTQANYFALWRDLVNRPGFYGGHFV